MLQALYAHGSCVNLRHITQRFAAAFNEYGRRVDQVRIDVRGNSSNSIVLTEYQFCHYARTYTASMIPAG